MSTLLPKAQPKPSVDSDPATLPADDLGQSGRTHQSDPQTQPDEANKSSKLYRRIWRWHFYAGMFAAPVLLVAAVTGGLYVFRAELEPIVYRSKMVVEPVGTAVSYEQQLAAARLESPPESDLSYVMVPSVLSPGTDRATMFRFDIGDHVDQKIVFVNPYTAAVTGSHYRSTEFFDVVLRIHRTLFAGTFGRILTELATCWGIVLVITGLTLWWPKKFQMQGVFVPRFKAKLYTLLRDLHAVPAVYLSLFLFMIMVTGLVFTNIWGTGIRAGILMSGGFPEAFVSPPQSTVPAGVDSPSAIALDQVVKVVRDQGYPNEELRISVPHHEATDPYVVSAYQSTGTGLVAQLHLDQYDGRLLSNSNIENVPAATVALLYALPIHQGSIFGLPTKILAFISVLMLATLTVTGSWMWWKRRPKGTLGVPRRQDVSVPRWMIGLIVVLGIVMPVVGGSLVLALVIDWLWQRRNIVTFG